MQCECLRVKAVNDLDLVLLTGFNLEVFKINLATCHHLLHFVLWLKAHQECTAGNWRKKTFKSALHLLSVGLPHSCHNFSLPCEHLHSHTVSTKKKGGISLGQMVDDVAWVLSGQRCVPSNPPHLNHPAIVHMSNSPSARPTPPQWILQVINQQKHRISWEQTFSAWLDPVGMKPQKTWQSSGSNDCSGHSAYVKQQDVKPGLEKGNTYMDPCGEPYRH